MWNFKQSRPNLVNFMSIPWCANSLLSLLSTITRITSFSFIFMRNLNFQGCMMLFSKRRIWVMEFFTAFVAHVNQQVQIGVGVKFCDNYIAFHIIENLFQLK